MTGQQDESACTDYPTSNHLPENPLFMESLV
jgi:hypothetical protein